MRATLDQVFNNRTEGVNSIFTSYRTLYDIYVGALRTLNVNGNTVTAIQRAKSSVEVEQNKISNQLHAQGFILLTGAAEALLKDVFMCLMQENFRQILLPPSVNFSASDLQGILDRHAGQDNAAELISSELGTLMVRSLYSSKNPVEKVNFQNVVATRDILDRYFGIKLIDSDYSKRIHRNWQVRHLLIHSGGVIDERFVNNVKAVDLLYETDKIGSKLVVTKKEFDEAEEDFLKLFNELDQLVFGTKLSCSLINDLEQ